jgi:hypothetical protein
MSRIELFEACKHVSAARLFQLLSILTSLPP